MKTDARVRYTRMIIQKTFLDLLKKKPISKITVKEICDIAQINRATFYKHYQDPYDLLEQFQNEAIQGLLDMIEASSEKSTEQILLSILTIMKENKDMFKKFAAMKEDKSFSFRLAVSCFEKMNEMRMENGSSAPAFSGIYFGYIAGGTSGIIEYWLRSGMKESPADIAKTILKLNSTIAQAF